MTKITVDAELRAKLQNLTTDLELCDEQGRILARVHPIADMSEWVPISPDVSEEELDRREKSTEWYTTEQVRVHLRNLEKQ